MLVLAVCGLLALASPADTAVRVPGTTLRFGLPDTLMSARGFTPAAPGTRKGRCRFFGLMSDATLTFEGARLARAEFAVADASISGRAYVRDQLTAMGYRRSCTASTPEREVCDWSGRTRVRLAVEGANLTASIVAAGPADAAAGAPAPPGLPAGRAAPARPGTVPAPAETTARVPARDSVPAAIPPPAAAARAPAQPAAPAAQAVPVLPETLAVRVPGRVSAYAPATLLGEPHCDYPESARATGVQGRVWVLALVDTDGRVLRTQLKSGIAVLNAAALECARDWTFAPMAWKGEPCRYWVLVPVTFTVH